MTRLAWVRPYLAEHFAENVRLGAGNLEASYGVARPVALARSLFWEVHWFVRAAYCGLFGHDAESWGSHFGPDSAREVLGCRRCGETLLDRWYY